MLFGVSYRLARAKPLRALSLATQAGIAPEVLARYYADKLSQEELDELVQHAHSAQEMLAPSPPDG